MHRIDAVLNVIVLMLLESEIKTATRGGQISFTSMRVKVAEALHAVSIRLRLGSALLR